MKLKIISFCITACLLTSCTSEAVKLNMETEYENIVSYISGIESEYEKIGNIYRITVPEAETKEDANIDIIVKQGDSVFMDYSIYKFENGKGDLIATNNKTVGEEFPEKLLEYIGIKYGTTAMISGFYTGIAGAKENTSYQLIVPFEQGYGDTQVGAVPPYTTLFIEFKITEIKK